jgi:hypothetical protein
MVIFHVGRHNSLCKVGRLRFLFDRIIKKKLGICIVPSYYTYVRGVFYGLLIKKEDACMAEEHA